ncbi:MAG: S41 family peptidase [Paludibacteraceae bacterium]|nr:S41 family peptidase [Paludibacteraceae bacterium]
MKRILYLLVAATLSISVYASKEQTVTEPLEDVSKNLDIFNSLFKELYINYVDTIPVEKIVVAGINGMLNKLDPYTTYIPEDKEKDFKLMTTGEYGGIGALIGVKGDSIIVSQIYSGRPAQKYGLIAGDIILSIDDKTMIKKMPSDASAALKGVPGTSAQVKVKRYGEKKPISITIVRDKISLNPVTFSGLVADSIGLIRLSSFYDKSGDEVKKAFLDLKKQGIKSLILDLRGNPGGIVSEAVNICNLFIPKGRTVVSTKVKGGKTGTVYKTAYQPVDTEIPLVVLVNEGSASASEIVSGALQDEDRAVIMGQRTYGKGLVQTTAALPYGGKLKVTIAKYYTPSGRCIQKINYTVKDGEKNAEIPDSLTHEFKTKGGRSVRDGRGIMPDVKLKSDSGKVITYNLVYEHKTFEWATKYYYNHKTIAPYKEFELTDADFDDFKKFVLDSKFTYKVSTKDMFTDLLDAAKYEGVYEPNKALFDSLEHALEHNISAEMDSAKDEVMKALTSDVISRYYYEDGMEYYSIKHDKDIKAAIEFLSDDKKYKSVFIK